MSVRGEASIDSFIGDVEDDGVVDADKQHSRRAFLVGLSFLHNSNLYYSVTKIPTQTKKCNPEQLIPSAEPSKALL